MLYKMMLPSGRVGRLMELTYGRLFHITCSRFPFHLSLFCSKTCPCEMLYKARSHIEEELSKLRNGIVWFSRANWTAR